MTLRSAAERLLALFRGRHIDQDLEIDIQAHLELAERDAVARGLSPEEARRAARQSFGGIAQMKEEHRDRRSFQWIETMLRDLRYGVSSLVRTPGFTATVVGVLALGIGANVAMFSLVDSVLLKPLPFPDPDRIVRVWEAPRKGVTNATSAPDFQDWKRMGTFFEALTAEIPASVALTGNAEPVRLAGKLVTSSYFQVFSTNTMRGRTFAAGEDQPGATPVVVLSHSAWQTYFGGDPNILRRQAILDGEPYQVIGILPPGAFDRDRAQFWKPLVFSREQLRLRENHWLLVHGRLREGIALAQAQEQMSAIRAGMLGVMPIWKREWTMMVEPLNRLLVGDNLRQSLFVAFGAVFLVLLIACANVANLMLGKGAARRKEMAVRTALGASRGRLIGQLLMESLILCLLGGAAGLAVASLLLHAAAPFLKQSIPYTASLVLDFRVFAFTAAVAIGTGVLVGALPALQTSVGNLGQSLRQASRGSSGAHGGIRRSIVIAEVALSLVLVCGALLLFKSLLNLQQVDTGVRIDNVITMSVSLPAQAYPTTGKAATFYETVAARLQAIPGVLGVGLATHLPLLWIANGEAVEVAGVKAPVNVRLKRVDSGYFGTLGIPLLAGRGITERDRSGARRVLVINETLAARLADVAGMKNPVGHAVGVYCPRYLEKGTTVEEAEIIGIIRNERTAGPGVAEPPIAYLALAQVPNQGVNLLVHTQAAPGGLMPAIRQTVRELDPNLPLGDVATMEEVLGRTLAGTSRPAWLIGAFAAVALLLTAIGLYGVLAHAVMQQRREIGIRMALGARSRDVLSQVLGSALRMVAVGLGLGLVGAFALTRVMKALLFGVSPLDPLTMSAACVSILAIGMVAGLVPASRAARVDPVTALRDEG